MRVAVKMRFEGGFRAEVKFDYYESLAYFVNEVHQIPELLSLRLVKVFEPIYDLENMNSLIKEFANPDAKRFEYASLLDWNLHVQRDTPDNYPNGCYLQGRYLR